MRLTIMAVALATIPWPSSAEQARRVPQPPLKPFEFKGYVAGSQLTADQLAECTVVVEKSECRFEGSVAGVNVPYYVEAYKGRMTRMTIVLLDGGKITDIVLGFIEKYGHTCQTGKEPWTSAGGTKVDNTTLTWCFATGKLTVKQYGARIDVPHIVYEDTFSPPRDKPPVDF